MTEDDPKPAEGVLYDDPATADLAAKVTEAWTEFGRALGAARRRSCRPGRPLDLTLDPTAAGIGEAVYTVSVELVEQRAPRVRGQQLAAAAGVPAAAARRSASWSRSAGRRPACWPPATNGSACGCRSTQAVPAGRDRQPHACATSTAPRTRRS